MRRLWPSFSPYQGYYVVAALFVAEIVVTGITFYSFSLFIRAWQADPQLNWSLTQINLSFSVAAPLGLLTPLIGRVIDLKGPRLVMLIGVPVIALSFVGKAFMTELWHLYVIQAVQMLGQTAGFLGTGRLIGLWFQRNRGMVMGITMAGNNVGGIVMAPLCAFLIGTIGWRPMFLIFGIGLFILNSLLIYFFVKDKVEDVARAARAAGRSVELAAAEAALAGQAEAARQPGIQSLTGGWTWRGALGTLTFWLITIAQLAAFVSVFSVVSQIGKHLQIINVSTEATGWVISLLGTAGLIAKFIFGWASEKYPVRYVFAAGLGCQFAGLLLLFQVTESNAWLLVPFSLLFGIGVGSMGVVQPMIVLGTFGIASFGTIFGLMQVINRVGNAVAPPIVGYAVDATGTFFLVFVAVGFSLAIGVAALIWAQPPVPIVAEHRVPATQGSPRPL